MNILRKADPELNSDIEKLTKHIDEDLIEITNKNYYHNQYEKIVQKNKKRKLKFENMISIQTTMSTAETHPNTQTHKPICRKKLKNRKSIEVKIKKKFHEKELEGFVEKTNKRKKALHADNEGMVKEIYDAKKNLLKDIERQEKL